MSDLTPKQQKFVEEIPDRPQRHPGSNPCWLQRAYSGLDWPREPEQPEIQEVIAARRKAIADEVGITPEKIVAELAKIGFCNMQDYFVSLVAAIHSSISLR